MLGALLLLASAGAAPTVELDWVPLSRGDLAWVAEDRLTGEAVGEFDGWLRPAATLLGGAEWGRHALLGSLGLASLAEQRWTAEDRSSSAVGALRLELRYRHLLAEPSVGRAWPWLEGGVYGVLPWASRRSSAYTAEEQADAEEGAAWTRQRIGGAGLELGGGASVRLAPGLDLGAREQLVLHRGQIVDEDAFSTALFFYAETALLLQFHL